MSAPQPSMWDTITGTIEAMGKKVKGALPESPLTDDKAAAALAGTPSSTYTMGGGKRRKTRKGSKKSRKTRRR